MSFGFGVGDFIAVGGLCWKVYKKCRESPGNYAQLASEVSSLHAVIKETEELLPEQSLSPKEQARSLQLQQGCEKVLEDLEESLSKYESLGTKAQRAWDRFNFGMEDVKDMRQRIISNVSMLEAFVNASSQARLKRMLNVLMAEVRSGKREGSVISTTTIGTVARNDQKMWEELRRELEDVGISREVIVEKRPFIIGWFQEAVAAGKLEEEAPLNNGDSAIGSLTSSHWYQEREKPLSFDIEGSVAVHAHDESALEQCSEVVRKIGHDRRPAPSAIHSGSRQAKKKSGLRLSYLINRLKDTNGKFAGAVSAGDFTEAQNLLRKGADVNSRDLYGVNLLIAASENYWENTVRFLLDNGADTESSNPAGETPLGIAAIRKHENIARLLLESGATINARDGLGKTPLLLAAQGPLVIAAEGTCENIVRLLLEAGAYLEARDRFGYTPLHHAVAQNSENMVRLLLENGAYIEAKTYGGSTPLTLATTINCGRIVKVLLDHGADIGARDKSGMSVMKQAESIQDILIS